MVTSIVIGIVFFTLSFIALPIFVAIGLSAFSAILVSGDISYTLLPQRLISGMYSYPMLAIPFFLLAAAFMGQGGMTMRIVNVFNSIFGHIPGSLAMTDVGASMFFAGISGSGVADATSIGSIVIPAMKDEGYDADFAAALTAAASVCGPIIPPSIPFVIYGVAAQVSVLDLFMAGAVPGVVLGLALMGYAYIIAKRRSYPVRGRASFRQAVKTLRHSAFALVMPVFLVAGIFLGIFTVTELAAIAAVYSFIIGFFVYKTLKLRNIPMLMAEVGLATAGVMILVGATSMIAYVLSVHKVPQAIMSFFFSISGDKYVFLILVNILFLILGMCMDSTPATLMTVPVLLPVAKALGIDPVHFGLIMVFNLMLGLLTPPVCFSLSITAEIAKISLGRAFKACIYPLIIGLLVLAIITFWPPIGMTLVKLYK